MSDQKAAYCALATRGNCAAPFCANPTTYDVCPGECDALSLRPEWSCMHSGFLHPGPESVATADGIAACATRCANRPAFVFHSDADRDNCYCWGEQEPFQLPAADCDEMQPDGWAVYALHSSCHDVDLTVAGTLPAAAAADTGRGAGFHGREGPG